MPLIPATSLGDTLDLRAPVDRQRYQVKQALHWRRRKGTAGQLVALAWILSGFRARVIEPIADDPGGRATTAARILAAFPQPSTPRRDGSSASRPPMRSA